MTIEKIVRTVEETENVKTSNGANEVNQCGQRNSLTALEGEPQKLPYPKSVFLIVAFEFCERFNGTGIHTVQVIYFTQKLMFNRDNATVFYHTLSTMTNLMCILGAILSDCFLGKFKTILYFSLVCALGSSVVVMGAIPTLNLEAITTTAIGMILIALGGGALRPCVTAFGGDQFKLPEQSTRLASFFSSYYFVTYTAYVFAIFVTPIFRQDVHCFDENDCYSLAFGVPTLLMIIAIILLVSGKPLYKVNPPSSNVLIQVTKCIKHAIVARGGEKTTTPREHWLDYSEEKYGKQLIADTKSFLNVLVLFAAQPLYWSLIVQQGSRWTFQAQNMDGDIGFYKIKPDQIHVITPLLMLTFIPLFNFVIYPLLAKIGFRRPLQKMTAGLVMATAAFLLSAILELKLEATYPVQPTAGEAQLRFINGLPCNFTVNTNIPSAERFELDQFNVFEEKYIQAWSPTTYQFALTSANPKCSDPINGEIVFNSQTATTVFISGHRVQENDIYTDSSQKASTPMLRVLFSSLANTPYREVKIITPSENDRVALAGSSSNRQLVAIISGVHDVYIDGIYYKTIELKDGSVSTLIVLETPNDDTKFQIHLVEITEPNCISVLWQVPQYVGLALAEVLFVLNGYELSYTQAPANMKSVVQACYLTTIALGNIIVTIIAGSRIFQSQANEFFLFTGLMILDLFLFLILTRNYKIVVNRNSEPSTVATDLSVDVSSKD